MHWEAFKKRTNHDLLEDPDEIETSLEYFDTALLLAGDTKRLIDDWMQHFSQPPEAIIFHVSDPRTPLGTQAHAQSQGTQTHLPNQKSA